MEYVTLVVILLMFAYLCELKCDLNKITKEIKNMSTALDDKIAALTVEVAKNSTVEASALTLISGLAASLTAALAAASAAGATDAQLSAIQAQVDALNANDTALASAVAANTPAAPTT